MTSFLPGVHLESPSHPVETWNHRCGDKECCCQGDPWYDTLDPVWHQLRDYCRHKLLKGTKPNRQNARRCIFEAMRHIKAEMEAEEGEEGSEEHVKEQNVKNVKNVKKEQTVKEEEKTLDLPTRKFTPKAKAANKDRKKRATKRRQLDLADMSAEDPLNAKKKADAPKKKQKHGGARWKFPGAMLLMCFAMFSSLEVGTALTIQPTNTSVVYPTVLTLGAVSPYGKEGPTTTSAELVCKHCRHLVGSWNCTSCWAWTCTLCASPCVLCERPTCRACEVPDTDTICYQCMNDMAAVLDEPTDEP
jgi:hypothetical protein